VFLADHLPEAGAINVDPELESESVDPNTGDEPLF